MQLYTNVFFEVPNVLSRIKLHINLKVLFILWYKTILGGKYGWVHLINIRCKIHFYMVFAYKCVSSMWTQPCYNDKNPFTTFFNSPKKPKQSQLSSHFDFLSSMISYCLSPPTADGLSRISISPPSGSCTLPAIFSTLEQL